MRFVEAIQYSHPKEAILYIALLEDVDVAKEISKFVINTKNYEILLEPSDLRPAQYLYSGDLTISTVFGEKLYSKICHTVAEHLAKTGESPETAMLLYDKIDMTKEVINMWVKEQISSLEDINPLSFPMENYVPAAEAMKTTKQRHPLLFEKYEKLGLLDKYQKKVRALQKLECYAEFYSLVFQGKYEDSLQVLNILNDINSS